MDRGDTERAKIPATLRVNEGSARRQIVSWAGDLIRDNPDKFRVVHFVSRRNRATLNVETVLSHKDGDITVSVGVVKSDGSREQQLLLYDGSGDNRGDIFYRLDISREHGELPKRAREMTEQGIKFSDFSQTILDNWEGVDEEENPLLLVDAYAETKVRAKRIITLLQDFDEIRLPEPPLGNPSAPTLQQFIETVQGKTQENADRLLIEE